MRRSIVVLLVLLALPARAFATWSIVAVDRSTGRVVIASATCVDRDDEFLKGVQAVVVTLLELELALVLQPLYARTR